MTTRSQQELMSYINHASFAIDDATLFLDTHPHDEEALEYYQAYRKIRKQAMKEYRDNYGPITSYDVAEADVWTWISEPWPWEGVC